MIDAANRDGHRLSHYLPAMYQEQPAVQAFLRVLDTILFSDRDDYPGIAAIIGSLPELMDPAKTRADSLPWLASWVALNLPPDVPAPTQRLLIAQAVTLYQRRGTKGGLQQLLDIVTDGRATVVEPESSGFRVGAAIVGQTTQIGRDRAHYFEVEIDMARAEDADAQRVERG